jgi:hypothetical protein
VVELGVQTQARRNTEMRRPYPLVCRRHILALNFITTRMWSESMFATPSVDLAVIDQLEGVSIWGVPGLKVDSCVREVRTFDRNLPPCGKVNQSKAIFICTLMQAVLAYRWLM